MPRPLRIEYPGAIYHVMNSESLREQAGAIGGKRFSRTMTIAEFSVRRLLKRKIKRGQFQVSPTIGGRNRGQDNILALEIREEE